MKVDQESIGARTPGIIAGPVSLIGKGKRSEGLFGIVHDPRTVLNLQ